MKSTTEKVALAIAIILILLVISGIVGGVLLIKKFINISKDSITSDKFIEIMEDNDFKVVEVTKQFTGSDIYVKEGYVAKKDDYQIEFYTFKNVDDAESFYRVNEAKFDTNVANRRVELSGKNYASFNIEANGKYKFLERIDKTVIYINVDKDYKDDVKSIVKELLSTELVEDYGLITNLNFNYMTNINLGENNYVQKAIFKKVEEMKKKQFKEGRGNKDLNIDNIKIVFKNKNIIMKKIEEKFEQDDYLNLNKLDSYFNNTLINSYYNYMKRIITDK
jgi:hypothetical protein